MKLIFVCLVLVSWGAFAACPNLAGHYLVCRSQNNILIESTDLHVEQSLGTDGHEHFDISFLQDGTIDRQGYELIANQMAVTESWVSDTGVQFVGVTTTSCSENVLLLESVITADGQPWKIEHNRVTRQGDAMIQVAEGTVGSLRFRDTLTCR